MTNEYERKQDGPSTVGDGMGGWTKEERWEKEAEEEWFSHNQTEWHNIAGQFPIIKRAFVKGYLAGRQKGPREIEELREELQSLYSTFSKGTYVRRPE